MKLMKKRSEALTNTKKIRMIMKRLKYIILGCIGMIVLNFFIPSQLFAQSKARIENVDFFPDGSTLIITYDIVKSKSNETFKIWVDVYTEAGMVITPKAITGDAGSNIAGGENKRIIWDMEADQVYLDEDIAIVVLAESELFVPESKTVVQKEPVVEDQPKPIKQKGEKSGISVGGALGLSLVLPGLGRRVASGKGVAYLWGVAGYGCLAGAYFMNNSAYNNYEEYKNATTTSERDDLYNKAKNQDLYSKLFLGGAAAIWVVDLIVTGVKAGKLRNSNQDQRLSFIANYDQNFQQPVFGFRYRF